MQCKTILHTFMAKNKIKKNKCTLIIYLHHSDVIEYPSIRQNIQIHSRVSFKYLHMTAYIGMNENTHEIINIHIYIIIYTRYPRYI